MNIHCFYSDIVLSLQHLFDTKIFPGMIKGYQFNIGNRSLQLKYETGFEFPRMIINYQSSKPMNYHPYTWTRSQLNNAKIPVLYDVQKKLTLLLHEEIFEYQIQASVNCESQLQALQFEHILQNYMIINKYFHMYKFFSFLEIDNKFLQEDIFDVENDNIINLFSRYNPITNSTNYCFSVQYNPLVRMDSCDVQLGSTDQRSFQVSIGISMLNHTPVFLEIPPSEIGETISKKSVLEENIIIPTGIKPILNIDIKNDKYKQILIPIVVNNDFYEFNEPFIFDNKEVIYSGTVTGKIIGRKENCICKITINNNDFDCNCVIDFNYQDEIVIVNFSGSVSGQVSNFAGRIIKADVYNGEIDGNFVGVYNNGIINTKIHATYNVITSFSKILDYDIVFDDNTTGQISSKSLISVPIGTIDDCTMNTTNLLKIIPEGTRIREVSVLYNNQIINVLLGSIFCDRVGNFRFPLIFHSDSDNDAIDSTITGKVDSITRKISYNISSEYNFDLVLFKCDFRFKSSIGYGSSFIERINIDFMDTFQSIMTDSFVSESTNLMGLDSNFENLTKSSRTLIRTVILQYTDRNEIFIINEDGSEFLIKVVLDDKFNYDKLLDNIYWKFFVGQNNISQAKQPFYDSNTEDIQIKKRDELSKPNILEFICTREVYDNYFSNFSQINPILFQVYTY